jgi:hypothetical protein
MSYRFTLASLFDKARAKRIIDAAPMGLVFTVAEDKRSNAQNRKLWAMLTDVAHAKPEGRKHIPEVWKCIFMAALNHEVSFEMGLDNRPFPVGFRSSRLSKSQMADLITFVAEYGDRHGVQWCDEARAA